MKKTTTSLTLLLTLIFSFSYAHQDLYLINNNTDAIVVVGNKSDLSSTIPRSTIDSFLEILSNKLNFPKNSFERT